MSGGSVTASPRTDHPGASERTDSRGRGGRRPWAGFGYLLIIYIVWGTTYLAVRIGVREGSGFPPFTFGWSRLLAAGAVFLIISWLRRRRLPRDPRAILSSGGAGLLMWTGAFGINAWALQLLDSSYAAISMGAIPIWGALLEGFLDRESPSRGLIASLAVGLGGVACLALPELMRSPPSSYGPLIGLLFSPLLWAAGAILQTRGGGGIDLFAGIGYQKLIGSLGLLLLTVAFREPLPRASADAWWAWAYILVFGSLIAFAAFMKVLRMLPARIVMTYAFVNPAIASLVGHVVLGERLEVTDLAGMSLIAVGVAGALRERIRWQRRRAD